MKLPTLAECRKALTAASGAAAEAVSLGLLSGTSEKWVTGVLAVATAAFVYVVPNARTRPMPGPAPYVPEHRA